MAPAAIGGGKIYRKISLGKGENGGFALRPIKKGALFRYFFHLDNAVYFLPLKTITNNDR